MGITAVAGAIVALAVALGSLAWSSIRGEIGETREAMKALTSEVRKLRDEFVAGETARARVEERVEALRAAERRKEKP